MIDTLHETLLAPQSTSRDRLLAVRDSVVQLTKSRRDIVNTSRLFLLYRSETLTNVRAGSLNYKLGTQDKGSVTGGNKEGAIAIEYFDAQATSVETAIGWKTRAGEVEFGLSINGDLMSELQADEGAIQHACLQFVVPLGRLGIQTS